MIPRGYYRPGIYPGRRRKLFFCALLATWFAYTLEERSDASSSDEWTAIPSPEHPFRDLSNLPVEEHVVDAGKNISVACPGIDERSLVHELEWRDLKLSITLLKYSKESTTIFYRQNRISLVPRTFALAFHPIKGVDTGDYICLFNNNPDAEAVVRLVVYDVPDPPGRPMVLGFTSRTVNLSWAPSANTHNSPISHYMIHMRIGEKGDWDAKSTIFTRDNCTTYKLANLYPYTVYSFRVVGVNDYGPSEPSKDSYYIITLREAPTGKPVITTAHNVSATAIRVSWRAPTEDSLHGEFLGYRISYRPRDKPPTADKDLYIRDTSHRLKMGDEILSHTITNLEPYTQYLVSLQVFNPQGAGPPTTVLVMTDEGAPSPPFNLTVVGVEQNALHLQWHAPAKPNGELVGYRVYYMRANYTDVRSFKISKFEPVVEYTLGDLAPDTEYTTFVKAYTQRNEGDKSEAITWRTDIGPPPPPELINVSCVSEDALFVQWRRPPKYGQKIHSYTIGIRPETSFYFDEIHQPDCGLNTCFVEIPNLTTNTMYEVKVRGISNSKVDPEIMLNGEYSDTKKICLRPNCEKRIPATEIQDEGYSTVFIAACVCAVFATLLTAAAFILWRLSKSRKCFHAAYYYLEDPVCAPVTTTAEWESAPRTLTVTVTDEASANNEGAAAVNVPKRGGAIPVNEFEGHVMSLHVDGDIGFSREYEVIQTESSQDEYPSEHSQLPENRAKNRYLNITAYDHTRVHLLPIPGQKNDVDYLNANYIDGFQCQRAYIGTQGPLPSTFECFWRMVWEQRVAIIVMITNLSERGRKKCDMYWPKEGTETYGIIQVRNVREDVMATYTVRTFQIRHLRIKKKKAAMAEKIVFQYHYTNWPDHGTPDHPLPVLHFVKKSSAANPPDAGPIIVHCSAGVGRTGTYIVLDAMLKQIKAKNEVNIWGFLRHIRTQRNFLVQTEEQYIFIHDALVEAIKTGIETNIERTELANYIQQLQAPDESGNPWKLLRHQYELIIQFQPRDFHLVSAYKDMNVPKNRNQGFVPIEQWRVPLTAKPGVEGSDYINATWIQGFHSLQEFIITQHPLPHTVLDFWQMVWGNNAQTIVVVSPSNEDFVNFWPNLHDSIDAITHRVKTVGSHSAGIYLIREIIIESLEDDYELHCRLVECRGWPSMCQTVAAVYDLPMSIQTSLLEYQNGPVVVVDRYGCTEAATFCALSTLRKQMLYDDHVDVYMYAKLYHYKRPGVWQTIEDYLRLHKAVQAISHHPAGPPPDIYASTNGGCVQTASACSTTVEPDAGSSPVNNQPPPPAPPQPQSQPQPSTSSSSSVTPVQSSTTQITATNNSIPTTTAALVISSNGNIQSEFIEIPQTSSAIIHHQSRDPPA